MDAESGDDDKYDLTSAWGGEVSLMKCELTHSVVVPFMCNSV